MVSNLNDLKKQIFLDMLDLSNRVFIHIRYSEDVIIGNRGFLPEEKEKGIIIVLNRQMNFEYNDTGISAVLVFGTSPEKCFIPFNEILSIFSPELNAQFLVSPREKEAPSSKTGSVKTSKKDKGEKVIKVDFKKKK